MKSIWRQKWSKLTILHIFNHFWRQIDVNWSEYACYLNEYSSETLTYYKYYANHHKIHWKVVLWPFTRQNLTILRIFDHFLRWIDVNWHHYVCYFSKYSSETLTDCKYWCKSSYNPLKSDFVAIYSTKNYDFAHFRSFLTQRWRQIDISWRQYVCYLSKYSSNTLTDCIYWCKPS